MRVFGTKPFMRFASGNGILAADMCDVAASVIAGRVDANLGGGVIKQRMSRTGRGKSGGFRLIVLFRAGTNVFFVHGFAKSGQANISKADLRGFRKFADVVFRYSERELRTAVENGALIEVKSDED